MPGLLTGWPDDQKYSEAAAWAAFRFPSFPMRRLSFFTYLDAFDQDQDGLAELNAQHQRGGLGDGKIKARLEAIPEELIAPIRERRAQLSENRGYILEAIKEGRNGLASASRLQSAMW